MKMRLIKNIGWPMAIYLFTALSSPAQRPDPSANTLIPGWTDDRQEMPVTHAVDQPGVVTVTVILSSYTYPTSISPDGNHVSGSYFGGGVGYYWSAATGVKPVSGNASGVSGTGLVGGDYSNSAVQYNGNNVNTAGIYDPATLSWTFPGMNPVVPSLFSTDYNSGWDITADGLTIVGMQWYPNYDYSAFKWSQATGYVMIGTGVGAGSRASGISANGLTVFGWAQTGSTSRSPVVWYNNQAIQIDPMQGGEAFGASPDGLHVTGTLGSNGFIWTPQGTTTFSNTLVTGTMSPTTVMNDGTVFGYIGTAWPPVPTARRAFVRDTLGVMMTFNDYAASRGLENAQQWLFYSINDASEDGNKLLGAGKNPQGQDVSFIMNFPPPQAVFAVDPDSIDFGVVQAGTTSPYREVSVRNTGSGYLQVLGVTLAGANYQRFVLQDNNTYPYPVGTTDSLTFSVAFSPVSAGLQQADVEIETTLGTYHVPLKGNGTPGVGFGNKDPDGLRIYPVPASGRLFLDLPFTGGKVAILDLTGRVVLQDTPTELSNHLELDVSGCPGGIHLIRIVYPEKGVFTGKILIGR